VSGRKTAFRGAGRGIAEFAVPRTVRRGFDADRRLRNTSGEVEDNVHIGIRVRLGAFVLILAVNTAACTGGAAQPPRGGGKPASASYADPGAGLVAHKGEFRGRFVLTGELEAVRADQIVAPRTPSWAIAIRWMEMDGAQVKAGEKVVEFDNSSFGGNLEDRRLALTQAEDDLSRARASTDATLAERRFAVEQRRNTVEKARIDAAVPEALLERRVHQERQLRLDRARIEMEKAEEDLRAFEASSKADLETRRIAVEKARREIETTEAAIGALVLRAPRSGLLVVAQHPWEERKLQVGDTVYVGWSVMSIPDLSAMRVVASLSDVDDGKIAAGMPAKCTLDAYPGETFNGVVRELTPIAQEPMRESLRRAFRVIVELTRTDAEKMRPGMSVKVEVETARQSGALLAPRAALDMSADRPRAALAKGGDAEVRLGPCNASECVVESGLEEGTRLRTVR
jgi:hypothetical protein